ncbi:efflux RND transporter permease subunit [Algiphilus aromaticivorans]|uniref:efflux RND transporter permease subunit n=1 Tax=Algiphilus aromaticivorans TaxID=382454 RepID=UPI0005C21F5B|nr:efflux RND transporter permease subunit [Algiphilus aromaticivorans]
MAEPRGPIAWMAANHVAANLLMLVLLIGGLLFALNVKQEVFPSIQLDIITIQVPFPGATPSEVEEGVVLAIEENLRDIEDIKEMRSTASEGMGRVTVELFEGSDINAALNDVKSAVDRITTFPTEAEEPIIAPADMRQQVVSLILHGDIDTHTLKRLAEEARSELLDLPGITLVDVAAIPPPEISIEIGQTELRRHGLTLPQVAQRIDQNSEQLGAGSIEARGGEVLVRVDERRETAEALRELVLIAEADGSIVRLGDIARVDDGFRDTNRAAFFDGRPAGQVRVYRVGEQSPLDIAALVRDYAERKRAEWPDRIGVEVWQDRSELYAGRIGLLIDNGQIGVVLVLIVLGLFLRPALAFWVTLGIPVTFLGVFLFMPMFGVSVNMLSMFAFLLVLGIVVDDAIVVGEAGFHHRSQGVPPLEAAIRGAREVGRPVVFAVLTTVVAFAPLLFMPGTMGKFFMDIPLVVIPILLLSLVESLFILPAHLASVREVRPWRGPMGALQRLQEGVSARLQRFIRHRYRPFLARALRRRYLTLSVGLAALIVVLGLLASGRMPIRFMPDIEGDSVTATVVLPVGAPMHETSELIGLLSEEARATAEALAANGADSVLRGIYAEVGGQAGGTGPGGGGSSQGSANSGFVQVELVETGLRDFSAREFSDTWRSRIGEPVGVDRLNFSFGLGPGAGADLGIELAHRDQDTLERMAERLAAEFATYDGVYNIDDGFTRGKTQVEIRLTPLGRALGLDVGAVSSQLRGSFFGAEAERQQRGRDELRIYARLPEAERDRLETLENLILRTPAGGEVPLDQAANLSYARAFTSIGREAGRRVIDVTASVNPALASASQISGDLQARVLPELANDYPGMDWELSGGQEERAESFAALGGGLIMALFVMYALIAVAFHSYVQPLLIMLAIPFGLIGSVAGHMMLGLDISFISLFGLVALSGVVVNDSLVLIDAVNSARDRGHGPAWSVVIGSARRFRAVLLTSLTTFFGLVPMIFETSLQARFLIPMAVSLGFGVLFVTVIALVLIPAAYLALEDLHRGLRRGVERLPMPEHETG